MTPAPLPADESERLRTLRKYSILDTPPEGCFDRITRLAARYFHVQIALISLVDEERLWCKSSCGIDLGDVDRKVGIGAHAILSDDVMIVADATQDPRFADNPFVTEDPHMRFYAGAPLVSPNGSRVGTLCLIDSEPRSSFSEDDRQMLQDLAAIVVDEMEMRLESGYALEEMRQRLDTGTEMAAAREQLRNVIRNSPAARALFDRDLRYLTASESWCNILELTGQSIVGQHPGNMSPGIAEELKKLHATAMTGEVARGEDFLAEINDKWLRIIVFPWRDDSGEIAELVAFAEDVSERKSTELELERNREYLAAVLEHIEDGIVACDAEGKLNFVNRAARRIHGVEQDMDDEQELLPPDRWAERFDFFEADGVTPLAAESVPLVRAFRGETVDNAEIVIAPRGRSKRAVQASGRAIYGSDGSRLGAVVSMHDVTERQVFETELKRKKTELQLILDNVPVRIWFKNDKNRIVWLNEAAARSVGARVEDIEGGDVYELFPDMAAEYHADDLEVIKSGQPKIGIVEEFKPKDGAHGWARTDKVPYTDKKTGERFVLISAIDVTAVKQAEEILRENEAKFRFLYNNTPALMHTTDGDLRIVNVSDFWLETLGYTREEVVGRRSIEFQTAKSVARALDSGIPNLRKTGFNRNSSHQYVKKNGEIVDVLSSSITERDENNGITSCITVLTDVTQLKALEAQLMQAQKMEAVGQLTGGLAHDFNNLLAIVIGNLQLLERDIKDDAKTARKAASALNAAQRGADLTQRLLAFSRRQTLETEAVDPNRLISGMQDMLERTLGRSIVLDIKLGDNIQPTRTDINQLETAILNLAVNARDAMIDGGTLTIETGHVTFDSEYAAAHDEVSAGDYVAISVTDTGGGMAPEVVEKAFQPFFTTKEVGNGTGLGLSMVYGFAKQCHGHVSIISEVGVGTAINLYLPEDADAQVSRKEPRAQSTPVVGGSETILVVEDNPGVREVAVSILDELGYRVLEAESGTEALDILPKHKDIALIFTDIIMPGEINGADLAVRAMKLYPRLKIVYASGFAEASILQQSKLQTGGELLSKPYQRDELAIAVRSALDARGTTAKAVKSAIWG